MERPRSLLLVEDEQLLRTLVAQFLRAHHFRVVEAPDGEQAVFRATDSGPFDLVLMDLNLPVLSGVEACRRIRSLVPDQRILVCSAAILPDHRRDLADLGLDRFLSKPFHPETLVRQIAEEVSDHLPAYPAPLAPVPLAGVA